MQPKGQERKPFTYRLARARSIPTSLVRAIALPDHNEEVGREDSAPKSYLVAMPTPLVERKAASGSDRYSEVVPGSPESLARGMFPKGLPRNPRELAVSARESGKADIEGRP